MVDRVDMMLRGFDAVAGEAQVQIVQESIRKDGDLGEDETGMILRSIRPRAQGAFGKVFRGKPPARSKKIPAATWNATMTELEPSDLLALYENGQQAAMGDAERGLQGRGGGWTRWGRWGAMNVAVSSRRFLPYCSPGISRARQQRHTGARRFRHGTFRAPGRRPLPWA